MQLGYKDVYLSYFTKIKVQSKTCSSYELKVDGDGLLDQYNKRVLLFASKFKKELNFSKPKVTIR